MKILKLSQIKPHRLRASALTIGTFDGVHRGHRAIFARLLGQAGKLQVPTVALTFDPHPREVLGKQNHVPDIVPFAERIRLIAEVGVDYLVWERFTRRLAGRSPQSFMDEVVNKFHPRVMVVGHDFSFGKGREGDEAWLRQYGREHGFRVIALKPVKAGRETVSSSRIRTLIGQGEMERARRLLGLPFTVEGRVIHGHHRGRKLGFSTANLHWQAELIPPDGVYVARVEWRGQWHPALANIGTNPTFHDQKLAFEVHLLDFHRRLYGQMLRVAFLKRLRPEMTFGSAEALIRQIKKDVAAGRRYLEQHR
jgi:riboflavin kinase/FMN adenylyltransferase